MNEGNLIMSASFRDLLTWLFGWKLAATTFAPPGEARGQVVLPGAAAACVYTAGAAAAIVELPGAVEGEIHA